MFGSPFLSFRPSYEYEKSTSEKIIWVDERHIPETSVHLHLALLQVHNHSKAQDSNNVILR